MHLPRQGASPPISAINVFVPIVNWLSALMSASTNAYTLPSVASSLLTNCLALYPVNWESRTEQCYFVQCALCSIVILLAVVLCIAELRRVAYKLWCSVFALPSDWHHRSPLFISTPLIWNRHLKMKWPLQAIFQTSEASQSVVSIFDKCIRYRALKTCLGVVVTRWLNYMPLVPFFRLTFNQVHHPRNQDKCGYVMQSLPIHSL